MKYISTRGDRAALSGAEALIQGIAADSGLLLPQDLIPMTAAEWQDVCAMDYRTLAAWLMARFFDDMDPQGIRQCVDAAYSAQNFGEAPVRLVRPDDSAYFLELWHGPTCAFKDMALQLMPRLFAQAKRQRGDTRRTLILTATSGDTGKAALAGFADLPGFEIGVLYPDDGVSAVQRLQMVTQTGENVAVSAIEGNFDDAQSAVKAAFGDKDFAAELAQKNTVLSSANSINWGRLAPQIVYYLWSCAELTRRGALNPGQRVDFCVPTGNFGNILAAHYARLLGAPVGTLICASNANHILTDFIKTGVYNRNRPFCKTISPSMDILISSNLERLLWQLYRGEGGAVALRMRALAETGRYEVGGAELEALQRDFTAGWCTDAAAKAVIRDYYARCGYLMDPHTAVACGVLRDTARGENPCVIVSTANPFKFPEDVLDALGCPASADPIAALHEKTGAAVPAPLSGLSGRAVRFSGVLAKTDLKNWIRRTFPGENIDSEGTM